MLEIREHLFNCDYIYQFEDLEDNDITALRKHALNDYVKKCRRHYDKNMSFVTYNYQCDFMDVEEIQRDRYALYIFYPNRSAYSRYFHIKDTNRWIRWLKSLDYTLPSKADLLEFLQGDDN